MVWPMLRRWGGGAAVFEVGRSGSHYYLSVKGRRVSVGREEARIWIERYDAAYEGRGRQTVPPLTWRE